MPLATDAGRLLVRWYRAHDARWLLPLPEEQLASGVTAHDEAPVRREVHLHTAADPSYMPPQDYLSLRSGLVHF